MHKYQPRVHIVKKRECTSAAAAECELRRLDAKEFRTFVFPETVFIGVTAYQNQLVSTVLTLRNNSPNILQVR